MTLANVTAISLPSPPTNVPEGDIEWPTPPLLLTADPLLAFDPSTAPNNTSDLTFLLLATGGNNGFKLNNTCNDLIEEGIITHLEAVPGDVGWIEMITLLHSFPRQKK